MFIFPPVTGLFGVGTKTVYLIDQQRREPHNPSKQRELMIRVWYPADPSLRTAIAPYPALDTAKLLAKRFTDDDVTQLEDVRTHAIPDVPSLKEKCPVILFSHGYLGSVPALYTTLFAELASHGFMVVAIAHTYYAHTVTFPDGREITTPIEKYADLKKYYYKPDDLAIWVSDVQRVLEYVESIGADRIGIFGHSFGGIVASQVCLQDARVKAGLSLDGVISSNDAQLASMKKPFQYIFAQGTIDDFKELDATLVARYGKDIELIRQARQAIAQVYPESPSPSILPPLVIQGLKHGGFSDFLVLKEHPLFHQNKEAVEAVIGTAPGVPTLQSIRNQLVSFFKKQL